MVFFLISSRDQLPEECFQKGEQVVGASLLNEGSSAKEKCKKFHDIKLNVGGRYCHTQFFRSCLFAS